MEDGWELDEDVDQNLGPKIHVNRADDAETGNLRQVEERPQIHGETGEHLLITEDNALEVVVGDLEAVVELKLCADAKKLQKR
jgi:hypothetical protein